jgi:methylenetetrahydromethanopterin dehydrogenase
MIKVGVFKCGNIGTAPVLELLLDELADRKDIEVRVVTTGSKMDTGAVEESIEKFLRLSPDMVLLVSPNTAVAGSAKAREILSNKRVPTIVFTDAPGKRVIKEIAKQGLGYAIVTGDPLIGARKEFLDSTEMAIFNSNVIKVLACTGIFRLILAEIDNVITSLKNKTAISLPKLVVDVESIRDSKDFKNPYAKAKAMAAFEMLKKVAEINVKACFVEKDKAKYILLVACAHEIAQMSASLAEQAREIEKCGDTVLRTPHAKDGRLKTKDKLMFSPE